MRIFAFLFFMALICTPAAAQSKKELEAQNNALAQRISVLEKRMLTGDPAAERLMSRMDSLEASQRTLTGEVERLRFERDKLREEITALNDDLDVLRQNVTALQTLADQTKTHLAMSGSTLSGAPTTAPVTGGTAYDPALAGQPSAIPGPPTVRNVTIPVQEDYNNLAALPNTGKQKLAEGNFAGAQADFSRYLAAKPDAADAAEIHFWLGETYYVRQGYTDAADAYIASMRKDPKGMKAPDAMVRLAGALRGLGKKEEACRTLNSFLTQYPNASAALRTRHQTELTRTGC